MNKQHDVLHAQRVDGETMAEQWHRLQPVDYANAQDFLLRLGRIDTACFFTNVTVDRGDEPSPVIIFSDNSIAVMTAGSFPIERFLSGADYAAFVEAVRQMRRRIVDKADADDPAQRIANDRFAKLFGVAVRQMMLIAKNSEEHVEH